MQNHALLQTGISNCNAWFTIYNAIQWIYNKI